MSGIWGCPGRPGNPIHQDLARARLARLVHARFTIHCGLIKCRTTLLAYSIQDKHSPVAFVAWKFHGLSIAEQPTIFHTSVFRTRRVAHSPAQGLHLTLLSCSPAALGCFSTPVFERSNGAPPQAPHTAILGCADSRAPLEKIFDALLLD